ncbi:MAG: tRNA (guanosine(46)-N7)-methyltransferase TrmB [Gammaproteobacteria bacterium]|nr:tRNA (guanosine(46)-N7)-methyltransferase TrmB [Gammaproteobacteria bacterium]
MKHPQTPPRRTNRSFVIREGRFTNAQKKAFDELWPIYGIPIDDVSKYVSNDWFIKDQPLILDVGFGSGDSLLALAQQRPDLNFVGVEVYRPGIGAVLRKIHLQELENVRVIKADVMQMLRTKFMSNELLGAMVWFPDPWPKTRHHKRRLIQKEFLLEITRVIQVNGVLHLASDWQPYVEFMTKNVANVKNLIPTNSSINPLGLDRPPTRFEQRGLRIGHQVTDLIYRIEK